MTIYLENSRDRAIGRANHIVDRIDRLQHWIGKLQHLIAGVPLLAIGWQHVRQGGSGEMVSGICEILIAAAVLLTFLVELRTFFRNISGRHSATVPHSRFGWFDLAAGVFLLFEAFHGEHVKPFYQRARFYAGSTTLLIGLVHHRLTEFKSRRRFLTLDETGFECRTGPFRRLTFKWTAVASIRPSENGVTVSLVSGGEHELKLARFSNRVAAEQALMESAKGAVAAPTAPQNA